MDEIRLLLRRAGRRLECTAFLALVHVAAIVAAAVAVALALADRAGKIAFVPWPWVAPVLAGLGLIVAAGLWSRRRMSTLQIALAVDDRLALREKLSTALHCHRRDDAFAQAAVEDAVAAARDPKTRERLGRTFPVAPPRRWWVSPLLIAAACAVLLLPQADLFARDDPVNEEALVAARQETSETVAVLVNEIEKRDLLERELGGLVDDLKKAGDPSEALKKPENIKRDALRKVTELNRRLDEIITGEKGKTAKAVKEMLAKLKAPPSGAAKDLAEALAKGDFAQAKQALQQLQEKAQTGAMSPEQQAQLAAQLQDLARQLDQLAQQQQQLQRALQQAGLDPQLANNPQAMQQALQQAQNLNQQQRQQLEQMANAQQQACQMCRGLGGALGQMAQGMQPGQSPAGMPQASNQLSQMEQLQQLLMQAQAAANQCQGNCQGLGRGMGLQQQQWSQGGGMGEWGQGRGGRAPVLRTPSGTRIVKEDVPLVSGEIIARQFVQGLPFKGESKAKLKDVLDVLDEGYDEAQLEKLLPPQYHDAQKHYFGRLQKRVEAMAAEVEKDEEASDTETENGAEPEADPQTPPEDPESSS